MIFSYVDASINKIGEVHVVQVVMDNAFNNTAAKELLKIKRSHIFWSSCATHTINLMLQAIGENPKFMPTIESAKAATIFIYSHQRTLALMRRFTKKETSYGQVTKFASSYLSL